MESNMASKLLARLGKYKALLLVPIWVLLWILSWLNWLGLWPWVRMALSMAIFIVPGMTISMFLTGKNLTLLSHLVSGLAISVFLVGGLGLLGRVFHFPFSFIKPVFVLVGVIGLVLLTKRSYSELYRPKRVLAVNIVLFLIIAIIGIAISMCSSFGGDDFSYLAYLTNWQHAQALNFQDVIFNSGALDGVRFWLAMFPMNLAFLAEISKLQGLLLLGIYLEPFFVVIALLSFYDLCEDLFPSGYLPILALLLQFTFLLMLRGTRQPGSIFFGRLSEDKAFAAFILAPIFLLAIRRFLETATFKHAFFVLLIGLSLTLTHPIILAYCAIVAGLYAGILSVVYKDIKRLGIVVALLVVTLLPPTSLRFIGVPWVSQHIFGLDSPPRSPGVFDYESADDFVDIKTLIYNIDGTPFYGFNLERVQISAGGVDEENPWQVFFSWSYVWILGLGLLWSFFNLKKNNAAALIGATSLLILLCALPYTGWILGYFVSARMLWRSPWLLPIGLIGVVLLAEFLKLIARRSWLKTKLDSVPEAILITLVSMVCFVLIGYFSINVYGSRWRNIANYDNRKTRYEKLSELGDYLEQNIEQPSNFIAPEEIRDYLPGLSSKSKAVFFRGSQYTPYSVDQSELDSVFSADSSVPLTERLETLDKYHVKYVLAQNSDQKGIFSAEPQYFKAQKADTFWLFEYLGSSR